MTNWKERRKIGDANARKKKKERYINTLSSFAPYSPHHSTVAIRRRTLTFFFGETVTLKITGTVKNEKRKTVLEQSRLVVDTIESYPIGFSYGFSHETPTPPPGVFDGISKNDRQRNYHNGAKTKKAAWMYISKWQSLCTCRKKKNNYYLRNETTTTTSY